MVDASLLFGNASAVSELSQSIARSADANIMMAVLGVIGAFVTPLILVFLFKEQIINSIALLRVGRILKMISRESKMPVLLMAKPIDTEVMNKFESMLNWMAERNIKEFILILDTFGGHVFAMERISNAILKYNGKVHCYIPRYAMSAGTAIALSCDKVYMKPTSSLGPVDPQIGILFWVHSSKAWQTIIKKKGVKAKDESIAMSLYAEQYTKMIRNHLDKYPSLKGKTKLKNMLSCGDIPHASQLDRTFLESYGLKINNIPYAALDKLFEKNISGMKLVVDKTVVK